MATEQTVVAVPTVAEVQACLLANKEPAEWRGGQGRNAGGVLSRIRNAMADGAKLDSALIREVFAEFAAYKAAQPTRLATEIAELTGEENRLESKIKAIRRQLAEKQAKLAKLTASE